MPERADVLDRVRLGDVAILLIAPEQLRNRSVRRVLDQREIGAWVLDEAHCLSKWGHAFRPDYRYVGRFIRDRSRGADVPPVLCLTATAKVGVVEDITEYFKKELGIDLRVFDGGSTRTNLEFAVVPTSLGEKLPHIHQLLESLLPAETPGGAIVYCSTKKGAEDVAQFLSAKQERASYFHSGLPPESKKSVQERFIRGELRVLAATNAFGMGIDKPDVRLVIHADVPGSLENYLQEAGRAGRDRGAAHCVLLYTSDDVERQFGMSARSRLTPTEIQAILRALKRMDRKKRLNGMVVASAGEILAEDEDQAFERDSATDDTRVRTAVAWLEEATLLAREENQVEVFPSSLQVATVAEARAKLEKHVPLASYRDELLKIVEALIDADPDEGITTDELMGITGLSSERVRRALQDLDRLGIAKDDTALTAFVHQAVERSSQKRLQEANELEVALLDELRQAAPELSKGEGSWLHLRQAAQRLRDAGHGEALPEKLWRILRSLAADGRSEEGGLGSLRLRRIDAETAQVVLQREWQAIAKTAELRRAAAARLLQHLLRCLPENSRGTDLLAETTLGDLRLAIEGDALLKSQLKDPTKALERGLLWLHEQEVIRLNKGLAVFRSAMTIRLVPEKRGFGRAEFEPLRLHYDEQIVQIHVMTEYAQRGLQSMAEALRLTIDYFTLRRDEFVRRWLPDREKDLGGQTTQESRSAIVESLNNATQQRIVTDEREATNVLVLAGPGSGKTRVLVHRIAYLVRVRRENPRGILALAYNRHAAVEIRRRLAELIGDDAKGVTVLTCHALAMRLAGVSFAARAQRVDDDLLRTVIPQAIALLKGEGLAVEEADEQRDRLLAGFLWILVDEYQDIGLEQYELISALAGRMIQEQERKLRLFAVGDDDQNIYSFNGASVEFIRRFESDYTSKPSYLTVNYRSTAHIIGAANLMIEPARERMKAGHPIAIDRARAKTPPGGEWQKRDPVGQGRVQILPAGANPLTQAVAVMAELERLAKLTPDWDWSRAAVIAREWKYLDPVRAYCELKGIPAQMADEEAPGFWRLRETQHLLDWLHLIRHGLTSASVVKGWLDSQPQTSWVNVLLEGVSEFEFEAGTSEVPTAQFVEWLAEWGREVRRRQSGLLLLTAHRAKGLEFDHVAVLDGGWTIVGRGEDADAPRRLYYVAMTRARQTLTLSRFSAGHSLLDGLPKSPALLRRPSPDLARPAPELARRYERLSLGQVDLGYAGRTEAAAPIHKAIADLRTGAALQLKVERNRFVLQDENGIVVGRLAASYAPPASMQCISASVAAIIVRQKSDSDSEYQRLARCEQWEVVVPELVFAPLS
jgi:ATP-dependent DNA helicase RecQ